MTRPTTHQRSTPQQQLAQMSTAYWITQTLRVAASLNIPDLLKNDAMTSAELAEHTKVNSSALYRVLRALASVGIFTEDAHQRFSLTELGQFLRTDHPQSQRASILMVNSALYRAWGNLDFSVCTGTPVLMKPPVCLCSNIWENIQKMEKYLMPR